ncbi:Conserved_hypothetical protein [Hexamita inflata]|uniref:Uncharacterized protein n=1 Tax=Hexamita inflata TaxID=28002 RepID=A0ABP1KRD2_9EUKA
MSLEEKYFQKKVQEPKAIRKMPIRLEDGTVVYVKDKAPVEERNEQEEQVQQQPRQNQQKAVPQNDFSDTDAVRLKIATYCQSLMANPDDKSTINALFKLVDEFDASTIKNDQLRNDIDTSLEILLKNTKDEGALSQLRGLYNSHMDKKFQELINNCFKGHQNSFNQLQTYLKSDSLFLTHAKLVAIAFEVLQKCKYSVQSGIFFNLFKDSKITKVSNLVPKQKQKKQLIKKKDKEQTVDQFTQASTDEELKENQTNFLGNLIIISTKIIREHQKSILLSQAFEMIIRFSGYLNKLVFDDLMSVIKLYFYNWYDEQNFSSLLTMLGEQDEGLFSLKINKSYRIQADFNTIGNYVKNHKDILVLYDYKHVFSNFDLVMKIIYMVSNPVASDNEINRDDSVLLIYLLSHIYKLNTNYRLQTALACFKNLMLRMPGVQQAGLMKKVSKIINSQQLIQFAKAICSKYCVDWEDEDDKE